MCPRYLRILLRGQHSARRSAKLVPGPQVLSAHWHLTSMPLEWLWRGKQLLSVQNTGGRKRVSGFPYFHFDLDAHVLPKSDYLLLGGLGQGVFKESRKMFSRVQQGLTGPDAPGSSSVRSLEELFSHFFLPLLSITVVLVLQFVCKNT